MAKRSRSRSRPKETSKKANANPKGFWQKLHQQIIKLRLDLVFFGALAIFAIGMVLGVVFGVNFSAKSDIGKSAETQIPSSEQYRVPVQVIKIPPQNKPIPRSKIALPQAPVKQPKAVQKKQTPEPKIAQKVHKHEAPKRAHVEKKVPAPRRIARVPNPAPVQDRNAPWLKFAALTPAQNGQPAIAIVIDDLGIDQRRTGVAIDLPAPITLAFIPYGYRLPKHTRRARRNGHELLVHIPMEPMNASADPGKNALLTGLTDKQLISRIEWNLSQFQGFVGVNNHMGSKFTAWDRGMKIVVQTLKNRGLMFLDSKTTKNTVGYRLARSLNVPHAVRDVFLDNEISVESINQQLRLLESVARRNGTAIGIGHPHDATVQALRAWIPGAKKRGFILVPVSAVVKRKLLSG